MSALRTIIVLFIAKYTFGQLQQCGSKKPFMMPDKLCADFTEVCIKKEFKPCATLLDACQQCPPSNFTILTLLDIINMMKVQSNSTESALKTQTAALQAQAVMQQANFTRMIDAKCGGSSIVVIVLIILVLFLLVAVLLISLFICFKRTRHADASRAGPPIPYNEPPDQENIALVENARYSEEAGTSDRRRMPGGGSTEALDLDENNTITGLRRDNAYLTEANKDCQDRIHLLEEELQEMELSKQGLRNTITEHEVKIKSLEKELKEKDNELKKLQKENELLNEMNNENKRKLDSKEKEICDLKRKNLAPDQDWVVSGAVPAPMTAESKGAYPDWWKQHMDKS